MTDLKKFQSLYLQLMHSLSDRENYSLKLGELATKIIGRDLVCDITTGDDIEFHSPDDPFDIVSYLDVLEKLKQK